MLLKVKRSVDAMKKYTCTICGFVYDEAKGYPDGGIAPGTKWEELPDDWVCPVCGASKDEFESD
mgnify:FL=1